MDVMFSRDEMASSKVSRNLDKRRLDEPRVKLTSQTEVCYIVLSSKFDSHPDPFHLLSCIYDIKVKVQCHAFTDTYGMIKSLRTVFFPYPNI